MSAFTRRARRHLASVVVECGGVLPRAVSIRGLDPLTPDKDRGCDKNVGTLSRVRRRLRAILCDQGRGDHRGTWPSRRRSASACVGASAPVTVRLKRANVGARHREKEVPLVTVRGWRWRWPVTAAITPPTLSLTVTMLKMLPSRKGLAADVASDGHITPPTNCDGTCCRQRLAPDGGQ